MVTLGKKLPVTWVVDPDLLATVDAMTKPLPGGGAGRGRHQDHGRHRQAVAKQWLNDLKTAVRSKQVVALPFGDPDLASLAHRGRNVSGTLSHLKTGHRARPPTTVETILGVDPTTDFAWPVDGAVDPSIVAVATAGGRRQGHRPQRQPRETGNLTYTPNAARPIGGGTTAVVADAPLSTAFTGATDRRAARPPSPSRASSPRR